MFQGEDYLTPLFGTTGLRIVQRIMGLILMVIAVQWILHQLLMNGWKAVFNPIRGYHSSDSQHNLLFPGKMGPLEDQKYPENYIPD